MVHDLPRGFGRAGSAMVAMLLAALVAGSYGAAAEDHHNGREPEAVLLSPLEMKSLGRTAPTRAAEQRPVRARPAARRPARSTRAATRTRRSRTVRRATVRRTPSIARPAARIASGQPAAGESRFVQEEVLVRYRRGASRRRLDGLVRRLNLRHQEARSFALPGVTMHRYTITDGTPVALVIARLEADPAVLTAQPNYLYRLQQTAAAGSGGMQYALAKLTLGSVHDTTRGGAVSVAVIDTAIDRTHPELADIAIAVIDVTGAEPQPGDSHGTSVAGIIASRGTLRGIAPDARMIGIRAFTVDPGSGASHGTSWWIASALDRAHQAGARVLNLSFAGPRDPLVGAGIAGAARRGLIAVAAAGNDGPAAAPAYPAAYDNVIAVTATDREDRVYDQANRGSYIGFAAPGVDILAPVAGGGYEISSGTSLAAAHVSGLVALLLSREPTLSARTVRSILGGSAIDLGDPGPDPIFGSGLPNASAAVGAVGS